MAGTSILTNIRNAIKALILTMTTSNGYNFTWETVNNRNLALEGFPRAEVYLPSETCVDTLSGVSDLAYTNEADFEIHITGKLPISSNNPLFDIHDIEDQCIDDIKMLFGINNQLTGTCDNIMYRGFTKEIKSVDQFTPSKIIVKVKVVYSQDRETPTEYAV